MYTNSPSLLAYPFLRRHYGSPISRSSNAMSPSLGVTSVFNFSCNHDEKQHLIGILVDISLPAFTTHSHQQTYNFSICIMFVCLKVLSIYILFTLHYHQCSYKGQKIIIPEIKKPSMSYWGIKTLNIYWQGPEIIVNYGVNNVTGKLEPFDTLHRF